MRTDCVERLLQLGAIPERQTAAGMDAYALARQRGLHEVAAGLSKRGLDFGPRHAREARRKGVRDLCFYYAKANGFIYRVGTPDMPFLIGGDHDGAYPCTASEARAHLDALSRHPGADQPLRAFSPFLDLLVAGREFSFAELMRKGGMFSMHGFAERNAWGWAAD